jgi:hypothetical protein
MYGIQYRDFASNIKNRCLTALSARGIACVAPARRLARTVLFSTTHAGEGELDCGSFSYTALFVRDNRIRDDGDEELKAHAPKKEQVVSFGSSYFFYFYCCD